MSGHSKWAQIKRQKGATDQKRGTLFTKLSNAITHAARQGGSNPETNFKLRLAIDKAKSANMPKDSIDRAIKRGSGKLEDAQIVEETYECFGPGGIALIIEVLTDNKNRTVADIKHLLTKNGGSLAGPGAVMWQFNQKGVITINKKQLIINNDELELKLIDAGAEDIESDNEEIRVYTPLENLKKVKDNLEKQSIIIECAEIEFIPKEKIQVNDNKIKEKINQLFEALDEMNEVNDYYSNLL